MFKDIHLTAQTNDSKCEGVGSKKRPQKVFLAIMIAKNTVFFPYVRGKNFFPPF